MGLTISRWDHPRIRGEHQPALVGEVQQQGSSPHTRGALYQPVHGVNLKRIIPAYAGSTSTGSSSSARRADHPRIRGEHLDHRHPPGAGAGSSPHTRGARPLGKGPPAGNGIIPAYAGSTAPRKGASGWQRDHPRIRGEHGGPADGLHAGPGSSPHTRGAPTNSSHRRRKVGIIPAYAGSTGRPVRAGLLLQDHPRIRGEHAHRVAGSADVGGSSPHTRGARESLHKGDSLSLDHPRIRGEHPLPPFRGNGTVGSSPHTRGARRTRPIALNLSRIIPAYAGSTPSRRRDHGPRPDHPRIRGEHAFSLRFAVFSEGSSPHTRGAP